MPRTLSRLASLFVAALPLACVTPPADGDAGALEDLAARYAAAWSGGDPAALAAFYAEDGVLVVNDGEPARGRAEIEALVGGYMAAFPDMRVELVRVVPTAEGAEFHWHWTGTNTGPGGTGRPVDLTGFEAWTLGDRGRIRVSRGHLDEDEYARQMGRD